MGFNKPSKIQETALPMLLADPPNNMIAQSQSGTGKTAAFVLSMLSRTDATKNFTQAICLLPTYELALQTGQMAEKVGKFCPGVKIGYAVRGEKVSRGQKVTDHILFGTPGTLLDWIVRHRVIDSKKIKMFVLDEADVMIAFEGHQDQSIRIHKTLPKDCQTLLFSTTYDEEVMKFAKAVVPDPLIIRLRREEESLDNIKQFYVRCRDKEDKFQAVSNMYGIVSLGQCIVFCQLHEAASWLAQKMKEGGHAVVLLSEEITVEQRIAVLNRFREGKEKLLITTNVCARGIDVEQVTVVVNYDMPVEPTGKPDFKTYLHRIGRTGRFGKSGIAVNFIDGQPSMAIMKEIEEHFGKKILLLEANDDNSAAVAESSLLIKVLRNKHVQNKNEVEVQRNDPSSPLHSVKSFEELPLSEQLRRGVYDMGFNKPTKIQETALPMLLADPPNNMIAQSQPGTGTTAALVLSMLSRVDATKSFTQVICLSPTYELALQTGQVAEKMGKFCPEIKIGYAVRGEKVSRGQKVTDHILFGTPGTLLDWILRHRVIDPKKIKMFVVDEADVIIALQEHQAQSIRIHKTLPKDCQMMLFFTTYDEEAMKFAKTVVPDPVIIRLRRAEESLDNIKQFYVICRDKEDKFQALSNMYGVVSLGQCIVFCQTRKAASWLAQKMAEDGHAVALLSGEITVEQRIAVLNRFREGKEKLLITTNVCGRGIGVVEQVTVVVNFDMPVEPTGKPDFTTYLHRIGRTGRFGKSGIAVNFIDGQRSMAIMKKIEEHFGKKILLLETDDVDALEKLA